MRYNEGLWTQLKKGSFIVDYSKVNRITNRNIIMMIIYVMGHCQMKYSGNKITTEEELDIEVTHFKFLYKYGLL